MKSFFKSFFATLLALVVFSFLGFFILAGIAAAFSSDEKTTIKQNSVLVIDASESFPEKGKNDPFSELLSKKNGKIPNLSELIGLIHYAKKDSTIKGIFNGDEVLLSGTGKINNFNSDLDFILNLTDKTKFSHKLDIKTHFKISNNPSDARNKIAFLSLLGGSSVLDFTYTNKDFKGIIAIDADITNLDLYFDKLGIRKKQNDKSNLVVTGTFTDPTKGEIDFSVSSKSGLKTTGTIHINSNKATALRSAHQMSESAYKSFEISSEGQFKRVGAYDTELDSANLARQEFPTTFQPNGYIDILSTQFIRSNGIIHGNWVLPFITPVALEVDTEDDFAFLEYQLKLNPSFSAQLFNQE
jgi:hypothetical protein